jgi:hypothetical protein
MTSRTVVLRLVIVFQIEDNIDTSVSVDKSTKKFIFGVSRGTLRVSGFKPRVWVGAFGVVVTL